MKFSKILISTIYLVLFCFIVVKSHGPWKYYYPYPFPANPSIPRYQEFVQPSPKPTNICTECLNKFANFAKFFNFPNFLQFGNQNGNIRSTKSPKTATSVPFIGIESFSTIPPPIVQPPVTYSPPTPFTFIPQTVRPSILRKSTVGPAVKQPDPNPSLRIGIDENKEFISTEDRIRAILKTTSAPVTNQPHYTYPGIKNSLNNMDHQLADIRGPPFDGLRLISPFGR